LSIALDATLWDEPITGVGLYTRMLAAALEESGVTCRKLGARVSGDHPRGSMPRTLFTLGELPRILVASPEPLFHAVANFNLPLTRIPGKRMVLTVHDIIPDLLPHTVSRAYRWQFRMWLSRSLKIADRVICVSERSRKDLLARFDADPGRVVAIHNGVDHVDRVLPPDAQGAAYLDALGLAERYIVYAGALEARKNVALVLDAYERLWHEGTKAPLVLVGQRWFGSGPIERRIADLRASGLDIRPLGYQSDSIFYEIIRRAAVFVFPSRYEGFGLPPLEAMRLGVPTVVSTAGSLPEVCGDAAVQVDPDDGQGLADAVRRLLADGEERARRSEMGRRQAERFTWRETARRTLQVYEEALGGR
jgi:glycosyltransferase involved in cell wall biosynthesis